MEKIESKEKNWLLAIMFAFSKKPAIRRIAEDEKETLTSLPNNGYAINKFIEKINEMKRSVDLLSFFPFHQANA